ncbi:Bacteriophage Gp15 protein [Clostridium sp. ASBs410]|nr:Bacteriophage Gp15 protein [Clostridium sp. ASBs410]
MIGALPTCLGINGNNYPIETDYRNILIALTACADPEYNDKERLYILMKRLFRDSLNEIPEDCITEAAEKVKWFVDCGQTADDKKPPIKVIDWEQDEPIIFPAINKLAHREVRSADYIHWWTFMGYFMEIEDGTFSMVLGIRQKIAKGKKLEKWEEEFYRSNKALCDIKARYTHEEHEEIEYLNQIFG